MSVKASNDTNLPHPSLQFNIKHGHFCPNSSRRMIPATVLTRFPSSKPIGVPKSSHQSCRLTFHSNAIKVIRHINGYFTSQRGIQTDTAQQIFRLSFLYSVARRLTFRDNISVPIQGPSTPRPSPWTCDPLSGTSVTNNQPTPRYIPEQRGPDLQPLDLAKKLSFQSRRCWANRIPVIRDKIRFSLWSDWPYNRTFRW